MARPVRIDVADGWYHVTARGIDRRAIFVEDRDRQHFIELAEEMVERFGVRLHAYVLMGNHYHFLIQTPRANASAALQWVNVSYSVWFNRRHRHCGPLFQGRFKSIPIDGDGAWALIASLYLHLNPVRRQGLGLGKRQRRAEGQGLNAPGVEVVRARLKTLRAHRWSSYGVYAGYRTQPAWLTCDGLWARAQRGTENAKTSYRHWVEDYLRQGLAETPATRLTAAVAIGSVAFLDRMRVLVKGDGAEQHDLRRWKRLLPFERVVQAVEKAKAETWDSFCDRRGDWGRDLALWLGRKHCGLTLRELGAASHAMAYPAVAKAVTRMDQQLKRDRRLRELAAQLQAALSNVQT